MFAMHEATWRRIIRLAFLVLGLLPTVVLAGWGLSRHLPGHTAAYEHQLSQQLGLRVTLQRVEHPRPGTVLLKGLDLSDPESGSLLLHCRLLEATTQGDRLALAAAQPEVQAAEAQRLWQLMERRLQQSLPGAAAHVDIFCGELTWHDQQGSPTLVDVEGHIGSTDEGTEARFRFRLAGAAGDEPIEMVALRRTDQTTALSLHTGATPLPCSMLSPVVDERAWFGPRARFHGALSANVNSAGWQGELSGALLEVDLDALVTDHFPHGLGGLAEIRVERAVWHGGRIVEAAGAVDAGPGQISRSLVAAGRQWLALGDDAEPLPLTTVMPYDRLALEFAISPAGLKLIGRCPGQPGAMLVDAQQRTLWRQPMKDQPVVALLGALVPYSQLQVPATQQTDWLMSRLPVPDVQPRGDQPQLPQPHLRFGVPR